ncbi:MAG TPA: hypothetical protein VI522_03810, partial [Gammaproteobacteria bacterium]|nr:hypothetical protein [Gammaproteobacteria bacterium]
MKIQHSTAKFIFAVVILAPVFIWTQTDQADDTLPVAEHAPADMQVDEITHFKSSELCTGIDCPSGAYVVSGGNGEELFRISQVLKERGQVDQATGHWTNNRYAILIDTGQYTMPSSFELGYYTQVLGVGAHPDEVNVSPGIEVFNQCPAGVGTPSCKLIGGLNNFWRGIENLKMTITTADPLRLAISQATALRRLNVKGGELLLCDWNTPSDHYVCGYTSGGFMANSRIQKLTPGSQQQWLTRNAFLSESATAVWNAIFVGTTIENLLEPDPAAIHYGPENNKWENFPITMVPSTPIVREKPYLIKSKSNSSWQVIVPELKSGSSGPDWEYAPFKSLDISQFEVVASNPDSTGITTINSQKIAEINHELAQDNRHLLIMPGVYTLEGTLHVKHEDTVILGLGIPALVCAAGPCMSIDVERGVKLAGVTFDAGYGNTEYLLKVGNGSDRSNADNPHSLSDIYVRVAETQDANRDRGIRQTQTAVVINSNNVIGDNLWIWRGDHDKASGTDPDPSNNLVEWGENTALYGLIVYGKEVTMYGLAVEHFQDYQTLWYGNHGQVYFYQSEAPY